MSGNARRKPPPPGLPLVNPAGGISGVNGIMPMTIIAAAIRPSSATSSISHRRNQPPPPLREENDCPGAWDAFGVLPASFIFNLLCEPIDEISCAGLMTDAAVERRGKNSGDKRAGTE